MKAIVLEGFGGVEHLVEREIEKPSIKNKEVLIKVKAISINPVDVKVRSRKAPLAESLAQYNPLILGWDISGIIVETGSEVTSFQVGDEVFGMINFAGHGKAYAEYVAAPAEHLAFKPDNITHNEAAASTLAALTAWQAFDSYGKLRSTDKVLIHAAAGGVGHFAVQIAKHIGAFVIATSSAANRDFILELGADQHIDYKVSHFEEVLYDLDFVLEAVGGENFQKSVKVLKPFGTIVALPSGHTEEDERLAGEKNLHACYFMSVYSSGKDMRTIASLLEKGVIKPHISHVFAFNELAKAHQQIETGRTIGKVVVKL
ncbi:NADP-dependent oxidoreductase [Chryseobacterium sp. BIGb0232]|uniref:NADP-dependent oxidoreductase n=1 Tax=Chryseobacterium sp. BIGb0232 TaxID=2940598 RepID=UPI000F46FC5D|nr:NADP-dependent oxidoreductase [Chryseobacterium sp. BIGb0232]MCS4304176.1 NADPH:quinone reductase-like Zn-dependent oxidoreductase [Chryseobacterium sp. BIGb0232]ROS17755.1 NADPH:quinone reductase-like Zn-dependent oxidoreductase [Chryseobacterium nakagawai]